MSEEVLFWEWFWGSFARVAAGASIVGLGVSIWVLLAVRHIKSHYILRARGPELRQALVAHASELAKQLGDYPKSERNVGVSIAKIEAVTNSLRLKAPKQLKPAVRDLRKAIKQDRGAAKVSEDKAWLIYEKTQRLSEELKELDKDLKWEG